MRALPRTLYMSVLFCLGSLIAFNSPAQTAPLSIISPTLDESSAEPLTAKGLTLLNKSTWRQTSNQNKVKLAILKGTLISQTSASLGGVPSALDAKTGQPLWSADSKQLLSLPQGATDAEILFFNETLQNLAFLTLAADTGAKTEIWHWNTPTVPQSTLFRYLPKAILAGHQVIVGADTIINGGGSIVGFPSQSIEIRALDRKTGDELWTTPLPDKSISALASFDQGKILLLVKQSADITVTTGKSRIIAMDPANGKILWSTPLSPTLLFPPAIHGNTVISGNETGEIFAIDATTGQEKWRKSISPDCDPEKSKIVSTCISAGRLYIDDAIVLAPSNPKLDMTTLPAGATTKDQTFGALARFDVQTGRQTGYYGGIIKKIQKPKYGASQNFQTPNAAIEILQIKNGVIYSKTAESVIAIDQKTLKPLWRIPAVAALIDSSGADSILYLNTTRVTEDTVRDRQSEIFAIPLSAM